MIAVKTSFDGKKIVLPKELRGHAPGEVILIMENADDIGQEKKCWAQAQESSFAKVWDNDEDAVYDNL